jgi:CBS domain-containing protein
MKAEVQVHPLMNQAVAGDVMTGPAVACRDETLFEEIAEILADRDISGMPVVNDRGDVVGVISERDLAHALGGPMVKLAVRRRNHAPFRGAMHEMPWGARRAKDIMTIPAITVAPNVHIDEVARVMRFHQINRVPVVDGGRLIGVVTRGDVLGAIAHVEHAEIDVARPAVLVGNAGIHQH